MTIRLVGLAAAAALLFSPALAQAEDCYSLTSSRADLNRQGRQLVHDNPGITILVAGCKATADSNYRDTNDASQAAATFSVCGSLGCLLADGGYGNCLSTGIQILFIEERIDELDAQIRRQGCEQ